MTSLLEKFTVNFKIQAMAAILLTMLIAVSSISVTQLGNIKDELHGVSSEDIPLTKSITKLAIDQLELAIFFERALRVGAELETQPEQLDAFKQIRKKEGEASHTMEKDLAETQALLKKTYPRKS